MLIPLKIKGLLRKGPKVDIYVERLVVKIKRDFKQIDFDVERGKGLSVKKS